jgi:hypothetical protein
MLNKEPGYQLSLYVLFGLSTLSAKKGKPYNSERLMRGTLRVYAITGMADEPAKRM